jgi:uncharacterized protein
VWTGAICVARGAPHSPAPPLTRTALRARHSSLVAQLVHRTFPSNGLACIGLSAALPRSQLDLARDVATHIGMPLREIATKEGNVPEYVANKGNSCFYCKTELYTTLNNLARGLQSSDMDDGGQRQVVMFNGTNADDRRDPTRLGLVAADNFSVASPLSDMTKDEVRQVSRELGLPNWNHAASPCLRSRLAFNVEATALHLAAVESAERITREQLTLFPEDNLRVRMLAGQRVAIEVDSARVEMAVAAVEALIPLFAEAGLPTKVRTHPTLRLARAHQIPCSTSSGGLPRSALAA